MWTTTLGKILIVVKWCCMCKRSEESMIIFSPLRSGKTIMEKDLYPLRSANGLCLQG
jgi:hypothetical protein